MYYYTAYGCVCGQSIVVEWDLYFKVFNVLACNVLMFTCLSGQCRFSHAGIIVRCLLLLSFNQQFSQLVVQLG